MHRWLYRDEAGNRLAELSLAAPPPIGWLVLMVGPEMGPVREYKVVGIDRDEKVLVLRFSDV